MTIATLRPTGTVAVDGWTVSGAASVHAATKDDSDTSFVAGAVGGQLAVTINAFSVDVFILPAGALTKTIRPRCRARAVTSTSQLSLSVAQPASADRTPVGTFFVDSSQIAVATIPLTATIFDGSGAPTAWTGTQEQLQALVMSVLVSGADAVRVYELYVDIDYAEQPTTTVLGPTGTIIDSTSVTLEWQHVAGEGGGPQAYYQSRVFSTAQRSISGFDPATSPATLDTSVLLGTARALKVGPLPNNTAYRAYVRTAQSINGQAHWSPWASFSDFTVDAPAPTVLSVFAAGQDGDFRVRLTVTRDTAGEPWDLLEVERSDDAMLTWVPVRGATLTDPPGDVWIGYDFEAGNGVTVRYRARGVAILGTSQLAGEWKVSQSTIWSSDVAILKDLTFPANSRTVRIRKLPEPTRPIVESKHKVLGANLKTRVSDVRDGEEGDFVIQTSTFQEALDLELLLDQPVLLLQLPAAWDLHPNRYIGPGTYQRQNPSGKIWGRAAQMRRYQIPYTQVGRPVDNGVFIPGLTWEDMADQAVTWAAILADGTTWGDLL